MTKPIRPVRGPAALRRGAIFLVALLLAGIGGEVGAAALSRQAASEEPGENASCLTWIVSGMMKSRSGAT